MATATEPTRADADGYVDFDEFIDYQIAKTRSGIKTTDLLTAFIGGVAALLGYVLTFALFDHWILEGGFGQTTRYALLAVLVLGLVAWMIWKVALPYFRKVTPLYAAKRIEQTQPDLKNSLLTLVDLKQAGRHVPDSIEDALEKRSARTLSHMDVEEAVDRRLLMRLSYVLFALVVLTCAYVLFSPKKLSNSLWRALLPASNVSVATRSRIDHVEPGDVEVLARAQLTVTADISGEVPETVSLLFTTSDRRYVDEPVAMRETDEGLRRYSGVITGENGAGILQNLTYRVVAGDAESEAYKVTVKQAPSATIQDVTYEYPDYMGLSERTQPGGAIDAWEGTFVTVRARANMPLKSALIMRSDTEDTSQRAEEYPVEIANGVDLTARWRLKILSDGGFGSDEPYTGFYRIQCKNEAGETDVEPTLYSITIRPDLPPEIQLVQPTSDIERPANAVVPLLYAAEDRDFLLRSVVLHMELNGEVVPQQPHLYQAPPFRKSLHDVHNLALEPLQLNPGDRLTYWLEARDNMEPFADRAGNRANSPKLNITITEPASPEEVQEQLEQDQQQIAERLKKARQQPNDEPGDPRQDEPEMSEDTEPPPPNPDQPGEESQPQDDDDQKSGRSPASGSQQQPADGQTGSSQQQGSSADGQQSGEPQGGENEGEQNGSQDQPAGEESFDNLLERMMQREQQRQQEQSETGEQQAQQGDRNSQENQQPQGSQSGHPGNEGDNSGSQGGESTNGQPSENAGSNGESTSPSTNRPRSRELSSGSQSMREGPSAGEGTPSQAEGANDGSDPQPGEAPGGEPTPSDDDPPAGEKPTNDGSSTGQGQKQPGDDPTGAKPGDGTVNEGTQPKSGSKPPDPLGDQPGPQPGDSTENPDARTSGQPDGPDEPMQGEGDPDGQKSDKPQTGEGGNSQQTSQGNKGGDQKGPGDSTSQPGTQESANHETGQPGSQKPGDGSQQQSGGNKPGGEGSQPGNSESGSAQEQPNAGEDPSGNDSDSGGEGQRPETQSDSQTGGEEPDGEGEQPSGSEQPAGEPTGGEQSGGEQSGGDPSAGDGQAGGEPSGESGGEGQSGQPGGEGAPQGDGPPQPGGQPGAPKSDGQPASTGTGTTSDGGSIDDPSGVGGGGEGAPANGDGTAKEGTAPNLKPEDPDLEAKKKAANLVLEQLQQQLQRGEIDPELQDELNLTPEQLRDFTRRLEQRLGELSSDDTSPEAEARRRQFEETLRTIDFGSTGTTREGGDGPREAAGGFSGPNRPAPPEHRDAERLYRELLLKKQRR